MKYVISGAVDSDMDADLLYCYEPIAELGDFASDAEAIAAARAKQERDDRIAREVAGEFRESMVDLFAPRYVDHLFRVEVDADGRETEVPVRP